MSCILAQELLRQFNNLTTTDERICYMENLRFMMSANDFDYANYYSGKELTESEFYSIVDKLYQLDNLHMLSDFVKKNKKFLFHELDEDDFEMPTMNEDALLTRIYRIIQHGRLQQEGEELDSESTQVKSL